MSLRAVALVVRPGRAASCWVARRCSTSWDGGTGLVDALHWAGLALLAVAMVGSAPAWSAAARCGCG